MFSNFAKLLVLFAMCCPALQATASQNAAVEDATAPRLEVISVRQNTANSDPNSGGVSSRPDGVYSTNVSLHFMLSVAFSRQFGDDQIVGEPTWSRDDRFDTVGKVSEADLPRLKGLDRDQNAAMRAALMRQILMERFHLRTHIEERQGPVYALIVSKSGSKLKRATDDTPNTIAEASRDGLGAAGASQAIKGRIAGHVVTMSRLVAGLTTVGQLDRAIVDRTGLNGTYDYDLRWSLDRLGPQPDNGAAEANLPSLFTAIQEQLGLKLESAKGPIRTLVIDSVERPSAN